MSRTNLSLYYLAGYLMVGGLGFLFVPQMALELFLSNGNYADVMVRFVGLLLLSLGILISQVIRYDLVQLYPVTLVVRSIILIALVIFYSMTGDPLMLMLLGIVGLGFILTLTAFLLDRSNLKSKG